MTDVDCFCGCGYSFSGDLGVCPECGEPAVLSRVAAEEARQMRCELEAVLLDRAPESIRTTSQQEGERR
jgi:hypothetical protein